MTEAYRPQTPIDEYGKGGTKYEDGKLPKGGFRSVMVFGDGEGVKKSPTSKPEPGNRIIKT